MALIFHKEGRFMSKKNNIFSILALILAIAALVVSLLAYTKPDTSVDYAGEIQALQERNTLLQSQLDALSAQLGSSTTTGTGLAGWDLTVVPWETNTGASVTLTAVPANYEDGMTAALSIRRGSQEIVTTDCSWTGDAFTATAELTAQDGYGYYCILTDANGSRQQFALTTPENPVEDIPVYLATALSAYCNVTMDSWLDMDNTLTITLAFVQAQLPRLSAGGVEPSIEKAEFLLYYRGEVYSSAPITLEPGTGAGAYELTVSGTTMAMPQMEEDECLDLYLEVTLSDGQVLTALGASWYQNADGLFAVVG